MNSMIFEVVIACGRVGTLFIRYEANERRS